MNKLKKNHGFIHTILIISCSLICYGFLTYRSGQELADKNSKQIVNQTIKAGDIIYKEIFNVSNTIKTNQIISKATDSIPSQIDSFNSYKETIKKNEAETINVAANEPDAQNVYVGSFSITAYTWTGSTMANGEYPYVGCAASSDFPIGTVIYIENIGTYIIKDVCPTPGVIDLYMNTYDECINFGRRTANVYVI